MAVLSTATSAQVLFDNGTHQCISFTHLVKGDDGVQANQFLIVDHERGAMIDPGGDLTYMPLTMALARYTSLKNLDYVIASHQDPDIITSMPRWLVYTDAKIVASKLWARFLPHLNSAFTSGRINGHWQQRLVELPDYGQRIVLGQTEIIAIPAHFLHSVGNFQFYDPISKILFSGDLGASHVHDASIAVQDFQAHIPNMHAFHQRYMCANKVLKLWVQMVRQLDINMIVPQHGSPLQGRDMIEQFYRWLEQLPCGIDLMDQYTYRIPAA